MNTEKPVKVTISDLDTGAILEEKILRDDYAIICAGRRYISGYQVWGTTHTYNIKYNKDK